MMMPVNKAFSEVSIVPLDKQKIQISNLEEITPSKPYHAPRNDGVLTKSQAQAETALPRKEVASPPPVGKTVNKEQINTKQQAMKYDKGASAFKKSVEKPSWQKAYSDRVTFGAFARNYISRIHCPGKIEDVIYPTDKGLELELKNSNHDIFIRVGSNVPVSIDTYPIDFAVICEGEVFQVNGIIDSQYSSTNMELVLSGKTKPVNMELYGDSIRLAEALPHEEQISRILKRVWNDEPLKHWNVDRKGGIKRNNITLRQIITTNINGILAFDFLVKDRWMPINLALPSLIPYISGEVIAVGRVQGKNSQRIIVLTTEKSGK